MKYCQRNAFNSNLILFYVFTAALSLHCCARAFFSCSKQGLHSASSAQAPCCGGFSCCQAQAPGRTGFSSCGEQAWLLCGMWDLPGSGVKPGVLALAKSLQLCATLCDPMDCSLSDFSVHGIAMPSSRGSSWPRDQTCISCLYLFGRWILNHWTTKEVHSCSIFAQTDSLR